MMKAPNVQEDKPMSDQFTRARTPDPDPRRPFALAKADAMALDDLAQQTMDPALQDRLNAWWAEAGERLGFVWTTVADLVLGGPREPEEGGNLTAATFTAWPTEAPIAEDPDALAWLELAQPGWREYWTKEGSDPAFGLDVVLRAFTSGRNRGYAMAANEVAAARKTDIQAGLGLVEELLEVLTVDLGIGACVGSMAPVEDLAGRAQAYLTGEGIRPTTADGMELLRQAAVLFREYEANHRANERLMASIINGGSEAILEAAERNRLMAEKLEAFLANPTKVKLVHDRLREAREDAANGIMAGWAAAITAVRDLATTMQRDSGPMAATVLDLVDRLPRLTPPEDMDEAMNPWRGMAASLLELRRERGLPTHVRIATDAENLEWALSAVRAYREWSDKSDWLRQAMREPWFPNHIRPWGKHNADVIRELVQWLVKVRIPAQPPLADQPSARDPIAEGLECEERPDFIAWSASHFANGDIVEVREKDGHCHPMKVGSPQFEVALADLGPRMPVRPATKEQRKGWDG